VFGRLNCSAFVLKSLLTASTGDGTAVITPTVTRYRAVLDVLDERCYHVEARR